MSVNSTGGVNGHENKAQILSSNIKSKQTSNDSPSIMDDTKETNTGSSKSDKIANNSWENNENLNEQIEIALNKVKMEEFEKKEENFFKFLDPNRTEYEADGVKYVGYDTDGDGKIDMQKITTEQDNKITEEYDLGGDGETDVKVTSEDNRKEYDYNNDGKNDSKTIFSNIQTPNKASTAPSAELYPGLKEVELMDE